MEVMIHKQVGNFQLDIQLHSDASRIGILGASGSGKSMTLKSIAGIEKVDVGKITLGDRILLDTEQKINLSPQKRKIGYMFQNYALFPTMTVEKNIGISLKYGKLEKMERDEHIMERFRIQDLRNRYPGELSGGQQQRVALARIMVYKPSLIMLDEPFSALDQYLKDRLQFELLEMLEEYTGQVIMVSHSRDELYRFSEELYIMQRGKIMTGGITGEVFKDPKWVEAAKMTGCKNFSAVEKTPGGYYAKDWGAMLTVSSMKGGENDYVGYRAHYFEPLWNNHVDNSKNADPIEKVECDRMHKAIENISNIEDNENVIQVQLERVDAMPFEKKYYFHPVINGKIGGSTLCWFLSNEMEERIKQNGVPTHLRLKPEHIMFLKGK